MSRRSMLIEALEATPRDLARMLGRVGPAAATARPEPAGWSIAEVVAHMAAIEGRILDRLRQIVAEDNPAVAPLEPDLAAHDLERPLAELLGAFEQARMATLAFLRGLDQREWGRPLVHATLGPTRLREQVQALVGYDSEHLAQIATLRERLDG